MARRRSAVGRSGKSKPVVPPFKGAVKGKPAGRGLKGAPVEPDADDAAGPPPRAMRGRIAVAIPVAEVEPARRRMGPPPPGRGAPPRMTPPRAPLAVESPRAEALEERPSSRAPIMQQRGAPAAMARLRRGKVAF